MVVVLDKRAQRSRAERTTQGLYAFLSAWRRGIRALCASSIISSRKILYRY